VDGIPLRKLADMARDLAGGESEPHPWSLRAAVGSDYLAHSLEDVGDMTYDYGPTNPEYVVAMDGRFACNNCGGSGSMFPSRPSHATTTVTTTVPASTIVFTVTMDLTNGGMFVDMNHEADMAKLGKVYSLDGYLLTYG
jgi:hypothetical protein